MTEKEDDITIDLSKVASFLRGGKAKEKKPVAAAAPKAEKPAQKEANQDDDSEISLDLSKLGSLFKSKLRTQINTPKPKESQEGSGEKKAQEEAEKEFSLDLGKVKTFFAGINKGYFLLLLVLIPIILGVYIRMQTADLHQTESWARDTVNNYYKNALLNQINQQYPNLPEAKKTELLNSQFQDFLKSQAATIAQQTEGLSQQFKQEFRNAKGQNYMPDIDTYYWLRFIENLDKNGQPGDVLVNGQPFDNHFLAPIGRFVPIGERFPVYAGFYFYKVLHFLNSSLTPMMAFSYLPVFLFALSAIFIFLIGRRIAGNVGGLFAALLLAFSPYFVTKTAFGYADTDMYSVFFPLIITWLFFEAFESEKIWKAVVLSALAGFFVYVFNEAWGGWLYIFDFLLASIGLYIIYYLILNRKKLAVPKIRSTLIELIVVALTFFITSMILITVFIDFTEFTTFIAAPIQFISIKSVSLYDVWPNVYTTVAEQGVVPFSDLIQKMGGTFLLLLSIAGILLTLLKKDKNGHLDPRYAILLSIWFISTLYASTKGMRWILLLVPAFCVAFGAFAGRATQLLSEFFMREFKFGRTASIAVLVVLLGMLLVVPFNNANSITTGLMPDINAAWVRSLTYIKGNSSQDAIINSWWDYGHWFKYWADRRVTFDGTSQNVPQAHWIGRALLTDNQTEAVGILRMLDCGANQAYDALRLELNDSVATVGLLKQVILLDKAGARHLLLAKGVSQGTVDKVINYTYCQPPEDYFITSQDMVYKSGVWAHFGAWNFTRSDMELSVRSKDPVEGKKILMEKFSLSSEQADKYYYDIKTSDPNQWIAGWPSYVSNPVSCSKTGDLVVCADGMNFNLTSQDVYADTAKGKQYPQSLSFLDAKGQFVNKRHNESLLVSTTGQYLGVAIIQNGNTYQSLLMAPELAPSMFTRLFYFNGQGLDEFKPFYSDRDFTGFEIFVWKVDWPVPSK